jgi:hypothetical protein
MSHPLRKYARHVQKAIIEAGLPKPGYQWCLAMVQRRYEQAKVESTSIPERKKLLAQAIIPIAKLCQDVEGRYAMPSGGVLDH